jgi:hypothetical protein
MPPRIVCAAGRVVGQEVESHGQTFFGGCKTAPPHLTLQDSAVSLDIGVVTTLLNGSVIQLREP